MLSVAFRRLCLCLELIDLGVSPVQTSGQDSRCSMEALAQMISKTLLIATLIVANAAPAFAARIYVTNVGNLNTGTVDVFATDGTPISVPSFGGLVFPAGISVSGNHVYVTNAGNNVIGKYTSTGEVVDASLFSTPGSEPYGIAVSGSSIFITHPFGGRIGKYDAETGAAINASLVTGLSGVIAPLTISRGPYGIAVRGNSLFVTNLGTRVNGVYVPGSGSIGEYDATTGAPINPSLITGLDTPYALSISNDRIYVSNFAEGSAQIRGTGKIGVYELDGTPINTALVTGLWAPIGISAFGDSIYVTNAVDGNSIGRYDATTGATIDATFISGLSNPQAITVVPEPRSVALAIMAVFGFAAFCRNVDCWKLPLGRRSAP